MTFDKKQIEAMVNRFLGWKLPHTFCPDCYISFDRERALHNNCWPVGTNLLTADEALAMLEHVLDGADTAPPACDASQIKQPCGTICSDGRSYLSSKSSAVR